MWENNGTVRSDWSFDTVKSNAAMGTFRSMAKDLMPPGMEVDEEYIDDDEGYDDGEQGSVDTGAATKGSDPLTGSTGIGSNLQASHSTMIIKPVLDDAGERDVQSLLASGEEGTGAAAPDGPLGAPPAYTGSVRASRRASYNARNDVRGAGTLVREADLGTGVDTIRPVKKVDTAGSLRLSADFVGSARRDGSGSVPTSPTRDRSGHKRGPTELAKAGASIVDEVVLPILDKVCVCSCRMISNLTFIILGDRG